MRKTDLILAALVAFTACQKSETATSTTTTTTTQSTATTATVAPAPQPTQTTASASVVPTAGAIATADGERTGARVEVTELKRSSGGTVNLKFVIVNGSSKEFSMAGYYLGDIDVSKDAYRGVSGVHLLDPVAKKKYFVVTDSEKNCLCSKEVQDVRAGERVSLWAKFPAPPTEVTKLTIEVPHFQPMDDVPISQ